jgi:phosphorylcholine metabolism protein LicD
MEKGINYEDTMKEKPILWDKTEEQQRFHAKMLSDCKSVLDRYSIKSILSGSALLGMLRDGHLVPWERGLLLIVDFDDICIAQVAIVNDIKELGFEIRKHFPGKLNFKIQSWKKEFDIEIAGYYKEGGFYFRKTRHRLRNIPEYYLKDANQTIKIYNTEYIIPNDPDSYLTHLYGDWRTTIRSNDPADFRANTFIKKI